MLLPGEGNGKGTGREREGEGNGKGTAFVAEFRQTHYIFLHCRRYTFICIRTNSKRTGSCCTLKSKNSTSVHRNMTLQQNAILLDEG